MSTQKTNEDLEAEYWRDNYPGPETSASAYKKGFLGACELKDKIIAEKDARIKELEKMLDQAEEVLHDL